MVLKRKIYTELLEWKKQKGETALLIEGARRVGKSTIVEQFAQNEYQSYIFLDFSIASEEILSLFKNYASNLNDFFLFLSALTGVRLYERKSLIIFDEVQLFPLARQLIKHLVKDKRYDYIQTGSLLSIKQNVENIVLPSEERSIKMYPLDFEEFCWALDEHVIIELIHAHFKELRPLDITHQKAMKLFRQYMLIGGMPQAVLSFLETNDYTRVNQIKKDIIQLYRNDIAKYAKGYEAKVLSIFDEIPSQLSKREKKFTLSSLSQEARFRDYEDAFMWLSEAMIVNPCFNAEDPQVGLNLYKDRLTLKLYFADTGLLLSQIFEESQELHAELAKNIVAGNISINNGMMFENIISQIFVSQNKKLYFYSRTDNENSQNTMEIDFLIIDKTKPTKISPIEVKSGKRYTYSSLNKFKTKFSKKIGRQYLLHTKDLYIKDNIIFIPAYMAICL